MRSGDATIVRLKEMLLAGPLLGFLSARETPSGLNFTLKEGVIIAQKPR
jgi:hypothetical protein